MAHKCFRSFSSVYGLVAHGLPAGLGKDALLNAQVEDMEEELDQDTTSALDGIVGSYEFNDKQLQVFEELVRNMRGAAWGLVAATAVTVVLSATKQVAPAPFSSIICKDVVTMAASPLTPAMHKFHGQGNVACLGSEPDCLVC